MTHGTLDNDGGLGKKVGSSSDGKTEPFFLSGLDVDAFQANDLRATFSGVNVLCGKRNGRSLGGSGPTTLVSREVINAFETPK